ncbi:hypothetical protein TNCV_2122201 [Trichonephila clavipes]|nr:hypothetical protein TNCV_2122201 [Trichonephila clavipes]
MNLSPRASGETKNTWTPLQSQALGPKSKYILGINKALGPKSKYILGINKALGPKSKYILGALGPKSKYILGINKALGSPRNEGGGVVYVTPQMTRCIEGLMHVKPVEAWCSGQEKGMPAQVSSSSLNHGSK